MTTPTTTGALPLVQMRGIVKAFPGALALDRVDFELLAGEVHVLLGENGAGKSTLMKALAGVHAFDAGEVRLEGRKVRPRSVLEARRLGIVMVMQEFNLVPDLTVAENIGLINRPAGPLFGRVDRRGLEAEARRALELLGLALSPRRLVRGLSVAQKQMVEIAKALSLDVKALILDEPTAALTESETRRLFELIPTLTARGIGVVYISHRFEEIFAVGDRVTTLRDGRWVSSRRLDEVDAATLITEMAGRELKDLYPRRRVEPGEVALEVVGLATAAKVKAASFTLRRGEILGLAGLMGAGRTELARAIFGADPLAAGSVRLFGAPARIDSPRRAIELGLAYCSEDRKEEGLFLDKSLAWNISITGLESLRRGPFLDFGAERARARKFIDALRIKPPDETRLARSFSGGGQQKVSLAKWLALEPKVLILDEPTRGVDVGAKVEIYGIMDRFVAAGGALLLISSDLPELIAMSDRVLVMREGELAGELDRPPFSPEAILALATGVAKGTRASATPPTSAS